MACTPPLTHSYILQFNSLELSHYVLIVALNEILNPSSSYPGLGGMAGGVSVPKTEKLMQNLIDLQTAIDKQVVAKETVDIGNKLASCSRTLDSVNSM